MRLLVALLVIVFIGTQCARKMHGGAPSCIQQKIDELKAMSQGNPPAKITEYEYEGKCPGFEANAKLIRVVWEDKR